MQQRGRVGLFFLVVLSIWTAMNAYAAFRLVSVPGLASLPRWAVLGVVALLWLGYPLGRMLVHRDVTIVGFPLELAGAVWMGVLFLLVVAFLAVDLVTGFGWLLPSLAPKLRAAAALLVLLISVFGVAQAARGPVVREHEVALAGLPAELDGTVLVQLSDMHLGTLLGRTWLARRVDQVAALRPDAVLVVGDLVDGNVDHVEDLVPEMRRLTAPLGVWAVTGNHEFYAGLERSLAVLRDAGYNVLRDQAAEVAPGLVLAGVDDLTARMQFRQNGDFVEQALAGRPPGAVVLLSHSPLRVERAAELGAGLMLSGHTHDGQIWPFNLIVKHVSYPFIAGRYQVGPMTLIVCRGTGTWGPPMRVWRPSEIVRITLRRMDVKR